MGDLLVCSDVDLRPYTTLRAGGRAERLTVARTSEELAEACLRIAGPGEPLTVLGHGSNVLPSDVGVRGLTIVNRSSAIDVFSNGEVVADCGCSFQELFLKVAQAGLAGLEFAVGIPGTLGGALVSNAGAYRSNVADLVSELEIVAEGERRWVGADWLQFSYRDSLLRRPDAPRCALLRARLRLTPESPVLIYARAREFQARRILKQPAPASAGSFFKNVYDLRLAQSLEKLPAPLKEVGVVPAGYLIEEAGMKGARYRGAMFSLKHGNFILNVGRAAASDIRALAGLAKEAVRTRFEVLLEEEVLYIGDWSGFA